MSDSGEGLVDAEARLQERIEDRERERQRTLTPIKDPERARKMESLRLARMELQRQSNSTEHPVRKNQLAMALAELDKRIAEA